VTTVTTVDVPVRPDIDLTVLPDLDAEVPCGFDRDGTSCPQPATWRLLCRCPVCRVSLGSPLCGPHRIEVALTRIRGTVSACHRAQVVDVRWMRL
jgi:hypothetical protein